MANSRAVITEYEETASGQLPAKRPTASNLIDKTAQVSGASLGAVGTHKSDGANKPIGKH